MRPEREIRELLLGLVRKTGDEKLVRLVELALSYADGDDTRVWRAPKWHEPTPGGVRIEVIEPGDRRNTLSRAEARRMRVDHWDRLWCHLAGVPTPVMGWRGFADGTLRVALYSDKAGALATIEPGQERREWTAELRRLAVPDAGSLTCEVRRVDGSLLRGWPKHGSRGKLLDAAEAAVEATLPRRSKPRLEAYPAMLACWLARVGYGDLPRLSLAEVAEVVFGVAPPAGKALRGARLEAMAPVQKRAWTLAAAAERLIEARRVN